MTSDLTSPVWSWWAATGKISSRANLRATSCISFCSSESSVKGCQHVTMTANGVNMWQRSVVDQTIYSCEDSIYMRVFKKIRYWVLKPSIMTCVSLLYQQSHAPWFGQTKHKHTRPFQIGCLCSQTKILPWQKIDLLSYHAKYTMDWITIKTVNDQWWRIVEISINDSYAQVNTSTYWDHWRFLSLKNITFWQIQELLFERWTNNSEHKKVKKKQWPTYWMNSRLFRHQLM